MLFVFVKNKLISIDTILPILIELKCAYNSKIEIVAPNIKTFNDISKNIVLKDAIEYVGKMSCLTGFYKNKIIKKINAVIKLFVIFFNGLKGANFIHFGVLDEWPYKLFFFVFKKRIYLSQVDSYPHSFHLLDKKYGGTKSNGSVVTFSKNVILYNDTVSLKNIKEMGQHIYFCGPTRTRKSWIDFAISNERSYLYRYHPDFVENKYIVFVLSFFGYIPNLRSINSMSELFKRTIKVFSEEMPDVKILLKPHVFTDLDFVSSIIQEYNKSYEITYLHPTVLASNAYLFIANTYSTVLADAHSLGIPTVEFSDYSNDTLLATQGRSLGYEYVDYYINNDIERLKSVLKKISTLSEKRNFTVNYNKRDITNLLSHLS